MAGLDLDGWGLLRDNHRFSMVFHVFTEKLS
jgi:hypothetical protein